MDAGNNPAHRASASHANGQADVYAHLTHRGGLSEDAMFRFHSADVDGSLLLRIDEEDLTNDFSLDDKDVRRCLEIIRALKTTQNAQTLEPSTAVDFWSWRWVLCDMC